MRRHYVVVGGGMAAHRFGEQLRGALPDGDWLLTVIGEEPERPYDRVHLSEVFGDRPPEDLTLAPELWADPRIALITGDRVVGVDVVSRTVRTESGRIEPYDELVLATGSRAWIPPTEGTDLPGVLTFRTLADVRALRDWVGGRRASLGRPLQGVVVGGGVLGLEAAAAMRQLDVQATVVEFADRLMVAQLDPQGGQTLHALVSDDGIDVRTSTAARRLTAGADGAVSTVEISDDESLDADVVVYSTGIRPRDELARDAGIPVGERGGVIVDSACRTDVPGVWAIGECASHDGTCAGLVAPTNAMAAVVADRLAGGLAEYSASEAGTKLKGVGIEAASFGRVLASTPGSVEVVFTDPVSRTYRKLVVSAGTNVLLGGVFVGDIDLYALLRPMLGRELPAAPGAYLAPANGGPPAMNELPDDAVLCSCSNVTAGTVRDAVTEQGCSSVGEVKACTSAGTTCGSCVPLLTTVVNRKLEEAGITVSTAVCEHFPMSRAELYALVRKGDLRSFADIVDEHGSGRGCAVCRPMVASILASVVGEHPLQPDLAPLQDTNDRLLANMQKNGTYSVVPRMPGGEVSPEKLAALAAVAEEFGLFTRITGAQRIALFGARQDQLPAIWRRLIDAGFESGQAYGKSLRAVKACVGRIWCRFGVQDSSKMAIDLELRYRGLRAPHKLKLGVSGCARECAEARGKDVGVIATQNGWNVYVGGNGGFTPRHADLLAEDLDESGVVSIIDRFLGLYIRTADRLQRTARWVEEFPGGLDEIRRIVVDDVLGIGAELEAEMAEHVANYRDEWQATLDDPEKLAQFTPFVNAPGTSDPDLDFVPERGQARPALPGEHGHRDIRRARTLEETR